MVKIHKGIVGVLSIDISRLGQSAWRIAHSAEGMRQRARGRGQSITAE